METKLERYINYIVEDLVNKTEINQDRERVYTPFSFIPHFPSLFYSSSSSPLFLRFSKYLTERYGVRDEEVDIIWKLYKERILSLIDNE